MERIFSPFSVSSFVFIIYFINSDVSNNNLSFLEEVLDAAFGSIPGDKGLGGGGGEGNIVVMHPIAGTNAPLRLVPLW